MTESTKEGDKLSWEDTYRAMARDREARDREEWSDLDSTAADGPD